MRDRPDMDQLVEDLLAGRYEPTDPALAPVAAFLADVRSAALAEPEPVPGPALAALLGREVDSPLGAVGLRERINAAGRSVRIRVAAVAAIAVSGTLGVAGAGALPGPAQNAADRAFEVIGLERPNKGDDAGTDEDEAETTDDSTEVEPLREQPTGAGVEGSDISDRAPDEPKEDGREFGEDVSDDASEHGQEGSDEHRPDGQPGTQGSGPADPAPIDDAPPESTPSSSQGSDAGRP